MNMRGVFLHVMADALGSVVVCISALIMWLTEWEYKHYVDPGKLKNKHFLPKAFFSRQAEPPECQEFWWGHSLSGGHNFGIYLTKFARIWLGTEPVLTLHTFRRPC